MGNKNDARPGEVVQFADKERTIYPASLRQLRKLTKGMKELENVESDSDLSDESIDIMVNLIALILEPTDPKLAEDREALEDIVDIRAFQQAMAAAMGQDPNA